MDGLTRQKAEELNELFEFMLECPDNKKTFSFINVFKIYKDTYRLKDVNDDYVRQLLFIVRNLQQSKKIMPLISGDTLIDLNKSVVRDFLKAGGFVKIYNQQKEKKFYEKMAVLATYSRNNICSNRTIKIIVTTKFAL